MMKLRSLFKAPRICFSAGGSIGLGAGVPITSKGPLAGVRILDLTRVLAGPYCTMILGDLGADIIKVENPTSGDDTREWGPPYAKSTAPGHPDESAYFLGINRNKRSITVNFKEREGIEIIRRLAIVSDVLIENYIPGKLDEYGLGYEDLSKSNPKLIYASITGYGPDGPYAHRAGYDVIIEAEAGLMYITGEPNGPPVKVGVAITGLYTHGAVMAALYSRMRTGVGQKIDVSLLECQVSTLANIAHSYLIGGNEAKRWGTAHAAIVPYQSFRTKDSYVVFGAGNDRQFKKLSEAFGHPEWATDTRFATNADRVKHRNELVRLIEDLLQKENTSHWLKVLEPLGIPFAPVNNIAQTFEHPQVIHRQMIQTVSHPTVGDIKLVGPPVKYSDTPPSIRLPPPTLGQHTESILEGLLNYRKGDIERFKRDGIIRDAP
ncbi:putative l-carnitine dehydratase/alpha-methylacyl-CoA racemase [Cladochytrium replicatum]|nr:putative l-carnitine dehydratase/alpha-methylacyl-CoA racemase [Cladochytrium replicatum]